MNRQIFILLLTISICILNVTSQTTCTSYCTVCLNNTACQQCNSTYYVDLTAQCSPCNSGCKSCTAPTLTSGQPKCTQCYPSYNLNPVTSQCQTCSSQCAKCSFTSSNCTSCPEGNLIKIVDSVGTCIRDPACINSVCVICRAGSGTLCKSCKPGYFLRLSGECILCPIPCKTCNYTINSVQIISNYKLGIIQIKNTITLFNEYLIQVVDVMNRFRKFLSIKAVNPTVVFQIFLEDANYSMIPQSLNLNFTGPDFESSLRKTSQLFNTFIDDTLFQGVSNFLYDRLNFYSDRFINYTNSQTNITTNTTNSTIGTTNSTIDKYLAFNYTDTDGDGVVDIGNSTVDWTEYFGNYDQYFGNGTEQQITIEMFYHALYEQTKFKRYFVGTQLNLNSMNAVDFFNFENAPATCQTCVDGFFFDYLSLTCKACKFNCVYCYQFATCLYCQYNYFFNRISLQCEPCKSPCLSCYSSATQCTSCIFPFKMSAQDNCIKCITPCQTCSPNNSSLCITCVQPFSKNANTLGTCFRCAQDICKTCRTTNTSICVECSSGYSLASGKCELCPAKCLRCSVPTATYNKSDCSSCESGYVINNITKHCDQCGTFCLSCQTNNPNICLSCQYGKYLSSTGACILCMQACSQCVTNDKCTVFKSGLLLFGNEVISCRPGCDICDNENPQKCLICQTKLFILSGTSCIRCGAGCEACSPINPDICTLCPSNRILSNGACILCPINCSTCNSNTECTSCNRGFILNDKKCQDASTLCPSNCIKCNINKICLQCSFGFVISSAGRCVKCVSSCGASCDASNPLICTGCTMGFQSKSGKCIRCPKYCRKCSGGRCNQCDHGYQISDVNSIISCVKQCIFPCKQCTDTTCTQCSTNFTLTANKCQPDITCGGKGCLFCPTGSYKSEMGGCIKCLNNCASCTSTNCLVCAWGYYLQNSTCVVCPQGAEICLDKFTSFLCRPGYLLEALNFDSSQTSMDIYSSTCKSCVTPCKECMFLPNLCLSCINDQYRLNGTSCLKKKVVGSEIRFDIVYEDFLKDGKAQQILSKLSLAVKGKIIITFMRSGSTFFGIAVSGQTGTSDSALANSVSTAVSSGSLGVPVMSSSVGIFFQDAPFVNGNIGTIQQSSNIGLIVGIIIGVVVLIILTVVLIFKLRRKPMIIQVKPQSNSQLVDLRLTKKKGASVQYSTLSSFANNSKVLFS